MSKILQLTEALDKPIIISCPDSGLREISIDCNGDATLGTVEHNNNLEELCGEYEMVSEEVSQDLTNATLESVFETPVSKPRKVVTNEAKWIVNERKRKFQAGEEFVNNRGQLRPSKILKNIKNCLSDCRYKCANYIGSYEREEIFKNYYNMDQAGKYNFIAATIEKILKNRTTTSRTQSRRAFSFCYYFNICSDRITVCKKFYLTTLAISQKPVYTVHNRKIEVTGTVPNSLRGKKTTKKISDDLRATVINHIKSFPAVESHYCRKKIGKTYLEANLNTSKMYDLYVTHCAEQDLPKVKESYYRYQFNTQFNIDFHKPKSDRCGLCEIHTIHKDPNDERYVEHITLKSAMRALKDMDKKSDIPIICFDLENVITCPKSEIEEIFYHSKLNMYNLTAHLSTSKTVYCAVWSKYTGGRSGNDIASAFIKILGRTFESNDFTRIITWSDSCVPQNKNSFMAYAIKYFLTQHPNIESIEMRYSLPGHSAIQEVDHTHSKIEKVVSRNELFSPIGVLRLLKNINRCRPYTIIQMLPEDFKDFESCSKILNFKVVPFASVRMIKFNQILPTIQFNLSYDTERCIEANLGHLIKKTRKNQTPLNTTLVLAEPRKITCNDQQISDTKAQHLKSMFKYMSQQDLAYYNHVLKIAPTSSNL